MNANQEQRSRVLSLFDEQARSLRRLALFFLLPALLFGIFIFLPFTEQVTSRSRAELELESKRDSLLATRDSLPRIMAVDSFVDVLRLRPRLRQELEVRIALAGWLTEEEIDTSFVRAWALGIRDVDLSDHPDAAELLGDRYGASECIRLDDRRWRDCFQIVPGYSLLCVGRGCPIYPDWRAGPRIEGAPGGPLDETLGGELLDSLSAVRRLLREDLVPVGRLADGQDADWLDDYARAVEPTVGFQSRLSDRRREVRDRIERLERDTAVIAANRERARRLIEAIEASGSTFETPLGPLPVGIRDLVFLYPAILGVAYFVVLAGFRRLVTLRRAYHELGLRAGSDAGADPDPLTLTAPLWYDPVVSWWRQVGRILVALVPLAFMIWSYVALRSGPATILSGGDSRFGSGWYEGFFWLALITVVGAFGRAVWAVREYGRALAAREPAAESRQSGDGSV